MITLTLNATQLTRAGLLIALHRTRPQAGRWYIDLESYGYDGPYQTPEQALLEGIATLVREVRIHRWENTCTSPSE